MLFNSATYLIFFPIVTIIFFILPIKLRKLWLLVASYYFYMCWNPYYLSLMLLSTLSTYLCGLAVGIQKEKKNTLTFLKSPKISIGICIGINFSILFLFKYCNFVIDNFNKVLSALNLQYQVGGLDLLLPVGISFYTFQAIGYIIDVYRGTIPAQKNFLDYALFVSFFPQLVAGPIERSSNLIFQITNISSKTKKNLSLAFSNIKSGIPVIIWGYFLKIVIADRAAIIVDAVFNNYSMYGTLDIIFASFLFAIQIYCDFNGYTSIARGCAKILGIELMQNFRQPYLALNIKDFWRRWHISLTSWFTDYLYIPLGGNRKGSFRKYLNTIIVFTVSGLWHGASWHYVAWGLIHGIFLVLYNVITKNKNVEYTTISQKLPRILMTFIMVDFAWIFFRANSLSDAIHMIKSFFSNSGFFTAFPNSQMSGPNIILLLLCIFILLAVDIIHECNLKITTFLWKQQWWFIAAAFAFALIFILIVGVYGGDYDVTQFIYFQF